MPPKKAAPPAGEAKKAAAPPAAEAKKAAPPKVEKAEVPAVASPPAAEKTDKKPAQQKNQPKQGKGQAASTPAAVAAPPAEEKPSASTPTQEKRVFVLSDDPAEAEIQKKLNAIEDEIQEHRATIVCTYWRVSFNNRGSNEDGM